MTTRQSPTLLASLLIATLCALVSRPALTQAQCVSGWLPGDGAPGSADGAPFASTIWDPDGAGPQLPRLVVAGGFTYLGNTLVNGVAQLNPTTGVWEPVGNGIFVLDVASYRVYAIAASPSGALYVGGSVSINTNSSFDYVARLNGNSWVSLGTGTNGTVNALAVATNGDLIVGGDFTSAGGVANTNRIARWNGSTWSAIGPGFGASVYALTILNNDDIVAGGAFNNFVLRWNGTQWFNMGPAGMNNIVYALATAPNGDCIAGGAFTLAGGINANRVARWNGTAWSAVSSGLDDTVRTVLPLPNGNIVAGGPFFSNVGGLPASRVALYNPSIGPNGSWSAMSSGLNEQVHTLAHMPNGNIFAGGYFTIASGTEAWCFAQWNGTIWSAISPGITPYSTVNGLLKAQSGDLLVGGSFTHIGPLNAGRIASFNGTNWGASGTGMNSTVRAIAQRPNGDFIVGGEFTAADGNARSRIARWTGSGYVDMNLGIGTFFNPAPKVFSIVTQTNGDVIAGGEFYEAGGGFAYNVARWNGVAWSSLDLGVDAPVRALLVIPNGDLIAGGDFLNVGGALNISAPHLARWNGATWSPIGGGTNGPVYALALKTNGDIVVGGQFDSAGGAPFYNNIASWNGAVWSPLSSGTDTSVHALAVRTNGDVIAGGTFTTAGGVPANCIARWTGSGWTPLGTGLVGNSGAVFSLATLNNGDLAVGGQFYFAGAEVSNNFARYRFGYANPVISAQPSDEQICYHGTTTTLSVTVAPGDYGTLSYQWWRYVPAFPIYVPVGNGTFPSGAVAAGATTPTLTISNFQDQDAGQYYCMVTSTCGIIPSAVANLTYCAGDFNCDGVADFFDYLDFVDAYSLNSPNADFNGDNVIDFFDYLDFVDAYSLGC